MKKPSWAEIVTEAHKKCGGKREIHISDAREFAGHFITLLSSDPEKLKKALEIGRRRIREAKKKREAK